MRRLLFFMLCVERITPFLKKACSFIWLQIEYSYYRLSFLIFTNFLCMPYLRPFVDIMVLWKKVYKKWVENSSSNQPNDRWNKLSYFHHRNENRLIIGWLDIPSSYMLSDNKNNNNNNNNMLVYLHPASSSRLHHDMVKYWKYHLSIIHHYLSEHIFSIITQFHKWKINTPPISGKILFVKYPFL